MSQQATTASLIGQQIIACRHYPEKTFLEIFTVTECPTEHHVQVTNEVGAWLLPVQAIVRPLDARPLWVVGHGSDCDGANSGHWSGPYPSEAEACQAAEDDNEWSDGIYYKVVNEVKLIEYLHDFNRVYTVAPGQYI